MHLSVVLLILPIAQSLDLQGHVSKHLLYLLNKKMEEKVKYYIPVFLRRFCISKYAQKYVTTLPFVKLMMKCHKSLITLCI